MQDLPIDPDVEVTATIEGMHAGRDELLEAAMQAIVGVGLTDVQMRRLTQP